LDTVFILSRGRRLEKHFLEIGRALTQTHRVIFICFDPTKAEGDAVPKEMEQWKPFPNVVTFNLNEEIKTRFAKRLHARKSLSESLEEAEASAGITLNLAASNYLLYQRFAREYFGRWDGYCGTFDEIAEEFLGSYDFFSEIIDQFQPSLIFCELPDLVSHRVAAALGVKKGVFTVGNQFVTSYEKGHVFLNSGTNRINVLLDHFLRKPELLRSESLLAADRACLRAQSHQLPEAKHIQNYRDRSKSPWLNRLKKGSSVFEKTSDLPLKLLRSAQFIQNTRWLERNMQHELPKERYILFPLHHQPEAATSLVAPRWVNQESICEQLAVHAPADIHIVVKENPRTYGYRGKSYFGPLLRLPNVHLLHPGFDNGSAFARAEAVMAISGTSAMECIMLQKRVAVLSDTFYSAYSQLRKLDFPDEIYRHLKDPSWAPQNETADRRAFVAAYIQSSFFVGEGVGGSAWAAPEDVGPRYANGLREFMSVVRRDNLNPREFRIKL